MYLCNQQQQSQQTNTTDDTRIKHQLHQKKVAILARFSRLRMCSTNLKIILISMRQFFKVYFQLVSADQDVQNAMKNRRPFPRHFFGFKRNGKIHECR